LNPATLSRIQAFDEDVVLPAFEEAKAALVGSGYQCTIAEASDTGIQSVDTGIQAVDSMLSQVAEHLPLDQPTSQNVVSDENSTVSESSTLSRLGHSFYVEVLQAGETEPIRVGQYCVTSQFNITATEKIQLSIIAAHTKSENGQLQVYRCPFSEDLSILDIQDVKVADIVIGFTDGFAAFEDQVLASDKLAEPSEVENIQFDLEDQDSERSEELDTQMLVTEAPLEGSSASESDEPDTEDHFQSSVPAPRIPTHLPEDLLEPTDTTAPSWEAPESSPQEYIEYIEPSAPLSLQQRLRQLSLELSPPGFPIYYQQNSTLTTPAHIKPVCNRHGYTTDLSLEYAREVSESDLLESLHCLSQYQSLKYLAHLHCFIQEQMEAWHKRNGQPSTGAIAFHLHKGLYELASKINQRIQALTESQLRFCVAHTLKTEVAALTHEHQQQQLILEQIEQNPVLGYLDITLLDQQTVWSELSAQSPFTDPSQSIDIFASHLTYPSGTLILKLIEACSHKKYIAYRQQYASLPELQCATQYTFTRKLYPKRSTFIGPASKDIYPRLELLWGHTDEPSLSPNPFYQIWCVYPISRTASLQWLIVAATDNQKMLRTLTLENEQVVQEGTVAYLERSLQLMTQSDDEYTCTLGHLVREAFEKRQIQYVHLHQTHDLHANKPRDIIQLQFQLFTTGQAQSMAPKSSHPSQAQDDEV
jgi:hypothetical protein